MAIYQYDKLAPNLHPETFIAEDASVIGDVTLEQGVSVWPQAVLRGDNEAIHIGQHSNVQEGAVLHADPGFALTVGQGVTIGHQAMLHGCTIGDGALIGIQAVVLNGAVIGNNCLVGAGAIVTEGKVFPDNSLILGAPAKVVRELTVDAIASMQRNATEYVAKGQSFKEKLIRIR
ncbi:MULTISPECIES: gamma carbonic anhydrase family protein [Pseudomonas]|uniref:gamma carbonic anhydrase family protein n=1 Tax=Pseudomonas TaxID=286 RepID=UPI0016273657|nr:MULTISPECIES: gamma carbonic anhydrase family protein [Pseudomonas]MDH1693605.1 gamma carbonic anhydrase family protein [Pseudomonas sp. GD03766]QNG09518.1 gamma carbonic anhydrase family protein [Pseudomonas putida]UFH29454.1 gamma carbonic anhydrase family protein [Pseudomonas sp. CIP-10]HDS1058066.1 gamma carbonic anhydrase family protein [Pseudomonas putida]